VNLLRLDKFVIPDFPIFLQMTGVTRGTVTVAIGRDLEGNVDDVLVLESSHLRLTRAAIAAVKKWHFKYPANQPAEGVAIVPIVRFLFSASGVAVVPALTGTLSASPEHIRPDAPVLLPALSDLESSPKPLEQPMPRISSSLRERLAGGTATVKFFVDQDGSVRVPVILDASAPELGQAAVAAVAHWRYDPPRIAGKPTIVIGTQTFAFKPLAGM
jgi:TonB family protein